ARGAACATKAVHSSAGTTIVATGLIAVATALAARPALGALGGSVRLPGIRRAVGPAAWVSVCSLRSAPREQARVGSALLVLGSQPPVGAATHDARTRHGWRRPRGRRLVLDHQREL